MKQLVNKVIKKVVGPVDYHTINRVGNPSLIRLLIEKLKLAVSYGIGFDNSQGLKNNFMYFTYHKFCKWNYKRLNPGSLDKKFKPQADGYLKNGFHLIEPDKEIVKRLNAIPKSLLREVEKPENALDPYNFCTRYEFSSEEVTSIIPLITQEVDSILKAIHQSYYMITSACIFRTVPSKMEQSSSWIWHIDEHPDCHVKLFYYPTASY